MNEEEDLKAIGERLRTQDNRITADPMFCVQEKVRVYGMDPQWCDDPIWLDTSDGGMELPEPKNEAEREAYEDRDDVELTGYFEYWKTVMAAFTEVGAQGFIDQDGHNHGELRIYVECWRRCDEMTAIRAFLMDQPAAS